MLYAIKGRFLGPHTPTAAAQWVAGTYAAFGALWIFFSDRWLRALVPNPASFALLETYKGWLYVAVTAAFLYLLVRRLIARLGGLQEKRRRSERKFRTLVESSLIGVYIIQEGRFAYANPRLAEIFGYAPDEIAGLKGPSDLVVPEDRGLVAENIRRREREEVDSLRYSFRGLRKDGKVIDVEALGSRTELDGKPAVIGMLLDHTERNLLQRQYLQAQKMEVVGRLAGGAVHDLNNFLTAINGLAEIAIPSLPPGEQARADLEEILRSSQSAAAITRQFLAFSRKKPPQPRPLDLAAVVRGAEGMLRRAVGRSVALELSLEQGLTVVADTVRLEQLLLNLAINARDAMPGGGALRIEAAGAEAPAGPCALLSVRDTGCGMDPATLARVFEPFFTTKAAGTGLGLSVVQDVVRESGGRLAVESRPGEGTAFKVYLPRGAPA